MSVLWIVNERWNCTSAWFQANTQGQSTLDQDPRDHDRDGHKVSLSGIKLQFVSRKSWRRKWNMTSIHTSKGLALLYRAWWKHFLCLWLWHTLARVDKGAFCLPQDWKLHPGHGFPSRLLPATWEKCQAGGLCISCCRLSRQRQCED